MKVKKASKREVDRSANFELDYSPYLDRQEEGDLFRHQTIMNTFKLIDLAKKEEKKKAKEDRLAIHDKYVGKGGYLRFIEEQIRLLFKMDIPAEKIYNKILEWSNVHRSDLIQDDLRHLRELYDSRWNRFELEFNENRPGNFGADFSISMAGIYAVYQDDRVIYFGTAVNLRQRFIQHVFPLIMALETPLYKYLKGNFEGIRIAVKMMDKKFERLTTEARFIHRIKPIVNTHYKIRES